MSEGMQCPKCDAVSGDDWSQCGKHCPIPGSPVYNLLPKAGRSIMYVGDAPSWKGKRALLLSLSETSDHGMIQFDDMKLPQHLTVSKKELIAAYRLWPEEAVSYTRNIEGEIDPEAGMELMTTKEFEDAVKAGAYTDDDGVGHPIKDGYGDWDMNIYPSDLGGIPDDATHVLWFNK